MSARENTIVDEIVAQLVVVEDNRVLAKFVQIYYVDYTW
jgi:hypothetical protein